MIVNKLIEYIDKIFSYTAGSNMRSFGDNTMMIEACVFCLSQMGELVKNMDEDFKALYTDIPWISISGLRNKIVHDYEGIKILLIWDIIEKDLPDLKTKFERIVIK